MFLIKYVEKSLIRKINKLLQGIRREVVEVYRLYIERQKIISRNVNSAKM